MDERLTDGGSKSLDTPEGLRDRLVSLRDLSDFCVEWPDIRRSVINAKDRCEDPGAAAALSWLIPLADKVCSREAF